MLKSTKKNQKKPHKNKTNKKNPSSIETSALQPCPPIHKVQ